MDHPFSGMKNLPFPDVCDLARLRAEGHLTDSEATTAGRVSSFIRSIIPQLGPLTPKTLGELLAEPIGYLVGKVESLSARVAELEKQQAK